MEFVEILYIVIAVSVVVITVTIVWLANELIGLIRPLRRSSEEVEKVTKEVSEKVLLVTEALDRAGMAATNIIGLVEDTIEGIKERRDQLADGIGIIAGANEYFTRKRASSATKADDAQEELEDEIEKKLKEEEDNKKKSSKSTESKKKK